MTRQGHFLLKWRLNMKIVVLIPARYESSRFPGKPLAQIAGKPMIQMVYENVCLAVNIDAAVVATDDTRIAAVIKNIGGQAVITSGLHPSGTDRIAQAADKMGLDAGDIVVNVQGDQPLIHPDCIDMAVSPFLTEPELEMSTLAFKIVNPKEITNPNEVKVTFDNNGYALYFSRSPIPYPRDAGIVCDTYKHLGVYAYTRRFLEIFRSLPPGKLELVEKLEQLRAIENGHKIKVMITPHNSPEVDIPDDIAKIEQYMLQSL